MGPAEPGPWSESISDDSEVDRCSSTVRRQTRTRVVGRNSLAGDSGSGRARSAGSGCTYRVRLRVAQNHRGVKARSQFGVVYAALVFFFLLQVDINGFNERGRVGVGRHDFERLVRTHPRSYRSIVSDPPFSPLPQLC